MRRFCLTLDLRDDPRLIAEYKKYHERVWPEITKSIRDAGIAEMEIYLAGDADVHDHGSGGSFFV